MRKHGKLLQRFFPNAKASELESFYSKTGKLQVTMLGKGKNYTLYTEDRITKEQKLNPNLPKEIKKPLGLTRDVLIAEKDKEIDEQNKTIQEDVRIANDENLDPAIREGVLERIKQQFKRLFKLEKDRDALVGGLTLRERVKNIFKKYGFTVTAIVLAVSLTIGVIVDSLTSGLKSVAKGVGNGLKDLGKKVSQILPGLIGTIVSFIFRTAGSVIGFLGKNAWLLILGVVFFAVEEFQKKTKIII